MKYSSYKRGSSALRRIINNENVEYSRHFAAFRFRMSDRGRRDLRGIYNLKTDNIIAFINSKGNVFMRPNSIYFDKIAAGEKKVIKNENLRSLRSQVGSSFKRRAKQNMWAEKAVDNLVKNDDKPNKVFLFEVDEGGVDTYWIIARMKDILAERRIDKKMSNTIYGLNNGRFDVEELDNGGYRLYWEIKDYAEEIARKEREKRIRFEVAKQFIDNIREIGQESIANSRYSLNPIQFAYNDGDEEVHGIIRTERIDMNYPISVDIREWLDERTLEGYIEFHEQRIGALEPRPGEDDMGIVNERQRIIYQYSQAMGADFSVNVDYSQFAHSPGQVFYAETPSVAVHEWDAPVPTLTEYYEDDSAEAPESPFRF